MSWSPAHSGQFLPITTAFASAACSNTAVTIPFAALESYGASTSGDFREFVYSVVDAAYNRIVDINDTLTASDSGVLQNFSITRSVDTTNVVGDNPTITKSYTITSVLNVSNATYDVAEE
jgi:hypothetical protein